MKGPHPLKSNVFVLKPSSTVLTLKSMGGYPPMRTIKPETPVSLIFIGVAICSLFAAYKVFQPQLEQIAVNKTGVDINKHSIKLTHKTQRKIEGQLYRINASLSRIEGRLEPVIRAKP